MQLELAVAVLVHEARRADYEETDLKESDAGIMALRDLFGLDVPAATELLLYVPNTQSMVARNRAAGRA